MASKGKFNYSTYISKPPQSFKWLSDDELEVVVGTKRYYYNDIMDMAGQYIVKNLKFYLKKNGEGCKATTTKGEEELYLTDEQEMKLDIVMNNVQDFFQNYDFTPESFCSFLRYLMRPLSRTDKVLAKEQKKQNKNKLK